jgi:SepF-like predicted cell division protein (DUF552 family)
MDFKVSIGGGKPAEKPVDEGPDFVELDTSAFNESTGVTVRIETLKDLLDTDRIQYLLREGNVVFLNIGGLRRRDLSELKRSVEKLKKTVAAMDGDIIGVDEDFLILTPKFAKIHRG